MANMCECAKSDRCKRANKCPYEYNHLAEYLCFSAKRYDKMTEVIKRKKSKVPLNKKGTGEMTIADQVYIALIDSIDGDGITIKGLSEKTGLDVGTVRRYAKGIIPVSLQKLEAILNAIGFKLDVVPLQKGDGRKDDNA